MPTPGPRRHRPLRSACTVAFSGGNIHANAVTGSDLGATNEAPFVAGNFAYGELELGSAADQIYFTNLIGSISGTALYARQVDLLGDTNNVTSLHSPFNIYYAFSGLEPGNAYLNDRT
jgi:hypothetical protein